MPIFQYKAFRPGGAKVSGAVEAEGMKTAIVKIKGQGLHLSEIFEYDQTKRTWLSGRQDRGAIGRFSRQLSVLLQAGTPLSEAMKALSEESKGYMKGIIVGIKERVQAGTSLERAMKDAGGVFPEFYTSMISAGEASGTLGGVLENLADFLEVQDATKEKIRAAMIYPAFMVVVGSVVLAFLFAFVIPKIVRIFENTDAALPMATLMLIGVSNFFIHYWWLVAGAVMALVLGGRRLKNKYTLVIDRAVLRLPLSSIYYARLTKALGFLLASGLPMLKALELSSRATGNVWLEQQVREAGVRVSEGAKLSTSIHDLPPVLRELMATGERSGRLAEVLLRAADTYEADFDRCIKKALVLVEPAMILVMGLVVGFIVLAILLPMFQLNQLIM